MNCDFFNCNKSAVTNYKGLNFCVKHDKECNNYIDTNDYKGLLKFWVNSCGGAKRMVKEKFK